MSTDELQIECSPVDTIIVAGGTSRSAVQTGRSISGASIDLTRLESGFTRSDPSPWLRVTLIDANGRRAWTNPVWRDEL